MHAKVVAGGQKKPTESVRSLVREKLTDPQAMGTMGRADLLLRSHSPRRLTKQVRRRPERGVRCPSLFSDKRGTPVRIPIQPGGRVKSYQLSSRS